MDGSTASATSEFSITAKTIVTRITEYPVEDSEEEAEDVKEDIVYEPVVIVVEAEKVIKPRKP